MAGVSYGKSRLPGDAMTHGYLTRAFVLSAVIAAGCGGSTPTGPSSAPAGTMSSQARAYLDQIVQVMRDSSINRLQIDWPAFTTTVLAETPNAQTIPDTFPAIRKALELLGDGHSSYRATSGTVIFVRVKTCVASGATVPAVPDDIGYVKVRAFSGSAAEATAFASSIQQTIRSADRDGLAGWIVDLRGNGGGNMWPMLAGAGPILGEGPLGFFIGPTGVSTMWEYRDGASMSGGSVVQQVPGPYRLRRENPRVAVLVDNGVASSGEATFIAFITRPDTRSFGGPTCGLSTANSGISLSDGAVLNLTVSTMADRRGQLYGDQVLPDEVISGADEVVSRAIEWLRTPR